MAIRSGQKITSPRAVDAALAVTHAVDNVSGTIFNVYDILPSPRMSNIPIPSAAAAQFHITNAATTDGYDLDVRVKYSHDGILWSEAGQGDDLANYYSAVAGDDLLWSAPITFIPLQPYMVFEYDNNNGTDDVTVRSQISYTWGENIGEGLI